MSETAKAFVRNGHARNDFDSLHAEGAIRFGHRWFHAQRVMVRLARNYGLDLAANRAFLTDVAWEICRWYDPKPELTAPTKETTDG